MGYDTWDADICRYVQAKAVRSSPTPMVAEHAAAGRAG